MSEEKIIRVSSIGHPCARQIWHQMQGTKQEFDTETRRRFEMGDAVEKLAVKWLQEDGFNVLWNKGSQEAPWEITIPVHGGLLKGHPDALLYTFGNLALIDIKSMKDRAFQYWSTRGTIANKFGYFVQVNTYAFAAGVQDIAIVGVNKDNSHYQIEWMKFDQRILDLTLAKAECLCAYDIPPLPGSLQFDTEQDIHYTPLGENKSTAWACDYCAYKDMGYCPGEKKLIENIKKRQATRDEHKTTSSVQGS